MDTIKVKINGIEVCAPKGSTILEAARLAHIEIPTLCFSEGDQRDRRLPHLRGGSERSQKPGGVLCIPHQ